MVHIYCTQCWNHLKHVSKFIAVSTFLHLIRFCSFVSLEGSHDIATNRRREELIASHGYIFQEMSRERCTEWRFIFE